jgi:TonB family protein
LHGAKVQAELHTFASGFTYSFILYGYLLKNNLTSLYLAVAKEKRQKHFIHQPVYVGGQKAMTQFIYERLKYPEEALSIGVEGIVLVEYDIDHKGNVVATRVLQSVGHGCDEEACRVVKQLKFQVEKNRGVHVIFHQKAKIQFKKPVAAPLPEVPQTLAPTAQVQYTFTITTTPAPEKKEEKKPDGGTTFSYTVQL